MKMVLFSFVALLAGSIANANSGPLTCVGQNIQVVVNADRTLDVTSGQDHAKLQITGTYMEFKGGVQYIKYFAASSSTALVLKTGAQATVQFEGSQAIPVQCDGL